MFVSVLEVKSLCKLIYDGSFNDDYVQRYINQAEAWAYGKIEDKYICPPMPSVLPSGLVSITANTKEQNDTKIPQIITGVDTLFKTQKLRPEQHIYIYDSNEVAIIKSVNSETELTVYFFENKIKSSNINIVNNPIKTSVTNSVFYILNEKICTAIAYMAAKNLIMVDFSDKAYNQDTYPFYTQYELFAKEILDDLENGRFYDSSLAPQIANNNPARLIGTIKDSSYYQSKRFDNEIDDCGYNYRYYREC